MSAEVKERRWLPLSFLAFLEKIVTRWCWADVVLYQMGYEDHIGHVGEICFVKEDHGMCYCGARMREAKGIYRQSEPVDFRR